MPFIQTSFEGLFIFEPVVWKDERGYFYESYSKNTFKAEGIEVDFVQDNHAKSTKGVLRGLHYQTPPHAQSKLVRVTQGEVLDVVVDIREKSPTFGKWFSIVLSEENKKQLFVPRGFAHGYLVLSDTAEFQYKCDNFYSKPNEGGLNFNDPSLNINWGFDIDQLIVSEKDLILPKFGDHIPYKP
jgi:dTDP-4-dehydrorhamnose 3,5-epimerase